MPSKLILQSIASGLRVPRRPTLTGTEVLIARLNDAPLTPGTPNDSQEWKWTNGAGEEQGVFTFSASPAVTNNTLAGLSGIWPGATVTQVGKYGEPDGMTRQCLSGGNTTAMDVTPDFSISAWFNPTKFRQGELLLEQPIFEKTDSTSYAIGYRQGIGLYPNGQPWAAVIGVGNVEQGIVGPTPVALNEPHFIVATYDGSAGAAARLRLYLDGELIDTTTSGVGTPRAMAQPWYIGDRPENDQSGHSFSGTIWEVRLNSSALSLEEIQTQWNTGKP